MFSTSAMALRAARAQARTKLERRARRRPAASATARPASMSAAAEPSDIEASRPAWAWSRRVQWPKKPAATVAPKAATAAPHHTELLESRSMRLRLRCVRLALGSGLGLGARDGGSVAALVDEDGAAVAEHHGAILLEADGADLDQALVRARLRFALAEHLALGVDGVAFEDGGGHADLVPAEVDGVAGDVVDREAGDQGEGEAGVDQGALELGLRRVIGIEVDGIGIGGEEREPGVVGLRDGASQRMVQLRAHLEILKAAALAHFRSLPSACAARALARVASAWRTLAASTILPSRLTAPLPWAEAWR